MIHPPAVRPVAPELLRDEDRIALVEAYCKAQGMWRDAATPDPVFTDTLELDLSTVQPSLAGPKRPQDRVPVPQARASFEAAFPGQLPAMGTPAAGPGEVRSGSVVIAAITSCTNTSNPSVMIGAGLLAKKAVEKGLITAEEASKHFAALLAGGYHPVMDYGPADAPLGNFPVLVPQTELEYWWFVAAKPDVAPIPRPRSGRRNSTATES